MRKIVFFNNIILRIQGNNVGVSQHRCNNFIKYFRYFSVTREWAIISQTFVLMYVRPSFHNVFQYATISDWFGNLVGKNLKLF